MNYYSLKKEIYFWQKYFKNQNKRIYCKCGIDMNYRAALLNMTRSMNNGLVDLVNSGRYDTSDTFTVVLQPFMNEQLPPLRV